MALRDLWAKLTGREKERPADPAAPEPQAEIPAAPEPAEAPLATTAPAPAETRSPAPEHLGAPPEEAPPLHQPGAMDAIAPEETRSGFPGLTTPVQPGDLPIAPPEVPPGQPEEVPPSVPERPVAPPPEMPAGRPPEQPAPPPAPTPAPPGWQRPPQEVPTPTAPAAPEAPPPEIPPVAPPAAPAVPPEVPVTPPQPAEPAPPAPSPEPPPAPPAPEPERPQPPATAFLAPEAAPAGEEARGGWFGRLRAGLSRSTAKLTDGLTGLFLKRLLDEEALEELEEALITADLGVAASARIVENFRTTRFGREVTDQEVKETLAAEIAEILEPVARPLVLDRARRPHVVLVVGVNGTGKTTTIAKLGQQFREEGRSVTFVAGDTFRAAAVEQLQIWGSRTGCDVVAPSKEGADAAGLAFDALKQAQEKGTEVLLVDTAGRLHNKAALMEELRKVVRVMQRVDPTAPHSVLLVLDATTGQNATQQCKVFSEMVQVTGLVVTKLDGSAKGGIVVALAEEFGIPVHAVGVGEKAADLRPFAARDFARSLLGVN